MEPVYDRVQNLESVWDVYGPGLWEILSSTFTPEAARDLWLALVLDACRLPSYALSPQRAKRTLVKLLIRRTRDALRRMGWNYSMRRAWRQSLTARLSARHEASSVPGALRAEARRLIPAGVVAADAQRHYRGPRWLTAAAAATLVLGVVCVGGVEIPRLHAATPASSPTSTGANLPAPLGNLPVQTVAQFRLSEPLSLSDVYAGAGAVYWVQHEATDHGVHVVVHDCPEVKGGTDLVWRDLVEVTWTPPTSTTAAPGAKPAWSADVSFIGISGAWLIAVVDWSSSAPAQDARTAVYGIHLPTGRAGLLAMWRVEPGQADAYHVAVGDGRIAVQPEIRDASGKQAPVGLPVQVYALQGSDPTTALHPQTTIPAPFGVMLDPVITSTGVVFQGMEGHEASGDGTNATWYIAPYSGSPAELTGPPLDGQPHWAVEAPGGKLWWAETTPAPGGGYQVLMGPLNPAGEGPSGPAYTLDGTVSAFRVEDGKLLWCQTTNGVSQLVVSTVQGGGT